MLRTLTIVLALLAVSQASAQQATFAKRAPRVGDQTEQKVRVEVQLHTRMRAGVKVLEEADSRLERDHSRIITAERVEGGRATTAKVEYQLAQTSTGGQPASPEPVHEKTYRCKREKEALRVETASGGLPPMAEFQIVANHMESLGRDNPLAGFLDGRTVTVGEKLALPPEVAALLLGIGDQLGEATRFDLTLESLDNVEGESCATFRAEVEAASTGAAQMRFIVAGTLVIQVQGCRAVACELSGPIGMSETRFAPGEPVQHDGTGRLRVAIQSRYRDAVR